MPEKCGCAALVDGNFPAAHVPVRMCPLHAAAPDLLAALKECIERACTTRGEWVPLETMKTMQAAIRKAEGGE